METRSTGDSSPFWTAKSACAVILWRQSSVKGNFVDVDSSKLAQVKKAVDTMLQ